MNSQGQWQIFYSMLAVQAPITVVCFIACIIVLNRTGRMPKVRPLALLGFGLSVALGVFAPACQASAQPWIMEHLQGSVRAGAFAGLGLLWSILRAISYLFLLAAVFAGRQRSDSEQTTEGEYNKNA